MTHNPAEIWHKVALSRDVDTIAAILHDDCIFESPVVHTPQVGKAITAKYLAAAGHTLGNAEFKYVGEWHNIRGATTAQFSSFKRSLMASTSTASI